MIVLTLIHVHVGVCVCVFVCVCVCVRVVCLFACLGVGHNHICSDEYFSSVDCTFFLPVGSPL